MQTGQRGASKLDIQSIVAELKKERERLSTAIAALEGSSAKSTAGATANHQKTAGNNHHGSRLTAAGRKRLSELMKKRWAERRKKASEKRS
jgi:hypothetical protein